jgi:adenylate cyclase
VLYLFANLALDVERRELRRNRALLPLEPKVFDLLVHLLVNRTRVVSKDELIASVWGGRIVSDAALSTCLNAVRAAIGDNGDEQRLIKTLPRKGVRFVGEVTELASGVTPPPIQSQALTALALLDKPSVAVLPFATIGNVPAHEYLAEGVADDIITALTRFPDLFVIARNSSFQYKGRPADVRQIGRELGVRYVLEGSLRRRGGDVRITVQLVDAEFGRCLWADRYDFQLNNVFEVHDEVAGMIAAVLSAHVNRAESERTALKPPASWQAYDFLLQAAHVYNSEAISSTNEARLLAERAIELDPQLARGYLIIASSLVRAWINRLGPDHLNETTLDRAHDLALKAVHLEPNLPQARAMLGNTLSWKGQHDLALTEFSRALKRNPNYTDWRYPAGLLLAGDAQQAIEVSLLSMRLDPFYPAVSAGWLGLAYYIAGMYLESAPYLREAIARAPGVRYGHLWLAATYAQLNDTQGARAHAAEVMRIDPNWSLRGTARTMYRFRKVCDVEHLLDGFRKAGLPEE